MKRRRAWFVVATLPLLLLITWLDGVELAGRFAHGQVIASALTVSFWLLMTRAASPRLRALMIVGLVAATEGEVVFSLGLGMYEYRLRTIPVYVPPGHTILYAAIFLGVRLPWVRHHARVITPVLLAIGAAYSVAFWQLRADTYGMICFGVFCVLLALIRGSRLFFAAMYLLVAYLELSGTYFGAWAWPPILLGKFHAISSANPPSGVAVFYCVFDLCCLALYFGVRWRSFERWIPRLIRARGARTIRTG